MSTSSIKQLLVQATQALSEVCERPRLEAEILLAYALGKDRLWLMTHDTTEVDDSGFWELVRRRQAHEPIEYITGRVSFYDIHLRIAKGALIPRPETELLVDHASQMIARYGITSIAEVGVGSGAVSIVLARKHPTLRIVATDISTDALEIARTNVEAFGLSDRITLVHTDLLEGVKEDVEMIVSNPPYIAEDATLDTNVKGYEPHEALFSGTNGDVMLRRILDEAKARRIGYVACEMGYDQKALMRAYAEAIGMTPIDFYRDLAGLDRGFTIRKERW